MSTCLVSNFLSYLFLILVHVLWEPDGWCVLVLLGGIVGFHVSQEPRGWCVVILLSCRLSFPSLYNLLSPSFLLCHALFGFGGFVDGSLWWVWVGGCPRFVCVNWFSSLLIPSSPSLPCLIRWGHSLFNIVVWGPLVLWGSPIRPLSHSCLSFFVRVGSS